MFHNFQFEQSIKPEQVDRENHVLKRVQMCRTGETNDGRANITLASVLKVYESAKTGEGLKARFGHPDMCSSAIGTYLGRWKNPEIETDGEKTTCFGDLHLAEAAASAPKGDLREYVEKLFSEKENDTAGASVVVEIDEDGIDWDSEELQNWNFKTVHSCDLVDEPAATDGMFSKFSADTMAGRITEFLDSHPEILKLAKENPNLVSAFLKKLGIKKESSKMDELKTFLQNSQAEFEEKIKGQLEAANGLAEKVESLTAELATAKEETKALSAEVETLKTNAEESAKKAEELEKANSDLAAKLDTLSTGKGEDVPPTDEPKKSERPMFNRRK